MPVPHSKGKVDIGPLPSGAIDDDGGGNHTSSKNETQKKKIHVVPSHGVPGTSD